MEIGNCTMMLRQDTDNLRLEIKGRIDSTNAENVYSKVNLMRKQRPGGDVIFDCEGLEYISSAGLRILLMVQKKEPEKIKLINVSQEVNGILDLTGFSELFDISVALRDISNLEVRKLGTSGSIALYATNDDNLLKVYSHDTSQDVIEKERNYARAAFMCGVPTLIPYDIVKYNGCYGMLYEFPKATTVSALIGTSILKVDQYAREMGKFLKTLHSCRPEQDALPDIHNIFEGYALKMSQWFNNQEVRTLLGIIRSIPPCGTFVYGEFHPRSVFMQHGELLVIDMSGIGYGNPIYDLGTAYMNHVLAPETQIKRVTGLDAAQAKKFWQVMLRSYLDTDDDNMVQECETPIRVTALLRYALSPAIRPMTNEEIEKCVDQARSDIFPKADELMNQLASMNEYIYYMPYDD